MSFSPHPSGDGQECQRCGALYVEGAPTDEHRCELPEWRGMRLYFHEVPERWPYASKGHHPARVEALARFLAELPEEYMVEIWAALEQRKR